MILNRIPNKALSKWKLILGEEKLAEVLEDITINILESDFQISKIKDNIKEYDFDIKGTLELLCEVLSSNHFGHLITKQMVDILIEEFLKLNIPENFSLTEIDILTDNFSNRNTIRYSKFDSSPTLLCETVENWSIDAT